jgi:hypothetical protein
MVKKKSSRDWKVAWGVFFLRFFLYVWYNIVISVVNRWGKLGMRVLVVGRCRGLFPCLETDRAQKGRQLRSPTGSRELLTSHPPSNCRFWLPVLWNVEIRRKFFLHFLGCDFFPSWPKVWWSTYIGKTCIFFDFFSRPILDALHPKTPGKQRNKYTYAYSYRDIAPWKKKHPRRRKNYFFYHMYNNMHRRRAL